MGFYHRKLYTTRPLKHSDKWLNIRRTGAKKWQPSKVGQDLGAKSSQHVGWLGGFGNWFLTMIGLLVCCHIDQACAMLDVHAVSITETPGAGNVEKSTIMTPSPTQTQIRPDFRPLDKEKLLRKQIATNAMVQHAWISSMVIPGLGQIYNKDYWKIPLFYVGFALVGRVIYSETKEMNASIRNKLSAAQPSVDTDKFPVSSFTDKRIEDCKRTRNLFTIIMTAWYLLNVGDAYASAHRRTIDFKDDIAE